MELVFSYNAKNFMAIGREGQNARLAARLTGVRVDIRSETQLAEGIPAGGRDADVEYADGEWRANAETGEMEWHAADGSVILLRNVPSVRNGILELW